MASSVYALAAIFRSGLYRFFSVRSCRIAAVTSCAPSAIAALPADLSLPRIVLIASSLASFGTFFRMLPTAPNTLPRGKASVAPIAPPVRTAKSFESTSLPCSSCLCILEACSCAPRATPIVPEAMPPARRVALTPAPAKDAALAAPTYGTKNDAKEPIA